jgi:uroporphyrinogen decarboxylase
VLDEAQFDAFSVAPTKAIVDKIRTAIPGAKIIGFAKGAGPLLRNYREKTGVNAVGLDWSVPLSFGAELQQSGAVQGNLDPLRLVAGGAALEEGIDRIMATLGQGPLIFNLGHGITPETPIAHVEALIARVRNYGN